MEHLGLRKAEMTNMEPDGKGRVRLEFLVPSRGLIGFRSQFLTLTSGTGILNSTFSHYGEFKAGDMAQRNNGVLVSMTLTRPTRNENVSSVSVASREPKGAVNSETPSSRTGRRCLCSPT